MDEDDKRKFQRAVEIYRVSKDVFTLKEVMQRVGFDEADQQNMTLQQRIRRAAEKNPPPSEIRVSDTQTSFDADQLRRKAPKVKKATLPSLPASGGAVTERVSEELIARIENAKKTAGGQFHATGGRHTNSDEYFIAQRRKEVKKEIEELESKKSAVELANTLENEALKVIEMKEKAYEQPGLLTVQELTALVKWKRGPGASAPPRTKGPLVEAWMKCKQDEAQKPAPWTEDDNSKLQSLKANAIQLEDTAVGHVMNDLVQQVRSTAPNLSAAQRQQMIEALRQDNNPSGT